MSNEDNNNPSVDNEDNNAEAATEDTRQVSTGTPLASPSDNDATTTNDSD